MPGFNFAGLLSLNFDAQDQPAWIGADQQIPVRIEGKRSRMTLVAFVEDLSLSVARDGEDFALIACGDEQSATRIHGQGPDVFRLGLEEYALLSGRSHFVDLSIGRGANVKIVLRVEEDRLSGQFRRLKYGRRRAFFVES